MIVVDTSALMALLFDEPEADAIAERLAGEADLMMSAGTYAEAKIVAGRRGFDPELDDLVNGLGFVIEPVTREVAERVAEAHRQWGKGLHPAGLNFGDCFGYATAKACEAPLLFVGDDFGRTDVANALKS